MARVIEIPYKPRDIFKPYHARTNRFSCIVAHRRAGKTVAVVNDQIKTCLTAEKENVRVGYIAPLRTQAKAIAWDYVKEFTAPIPGININESELRADFPNGSRLRLFGADNYDAMRGLYFDDVALDEPADFPVNAWPTVIRPALADRKGSATFIGTPKGRNSFYDTYQASQTDKSWFSAMHRASETGILPQDELNEALKIMGPDRYEQEFECSFEAAIQGTYYGNEMREAEKQGRITRVPYDKALPVITSWDLGVGDSTAIWFAQFAHGERRLIDYYETSGVGLDHYVHMLNEKGYIYGGHVLPHDIRVRELGTGKSRLEILKNLGVSNIDIAPNINLDDGIQATRLFLPNCWFDQEKCAPGIEALKNYRRSFDERQKTWRGRPEHDWTSHGADSFRYLAVGARESTGTGLKSSPRRNLKGFS